MLNVGDRVKTGNAKYQDDLTNSLNAGRTGTITDRWYYLTGAINYYVTFDEPYEFMGYRVEGASYMEIDCALEMIA